MAKNQRAKFKKAFRLCSGKAKRLTKEFGACMREQLKK